MKYGWIPPGGFFLRPEGEQLFRRLKKPPIQGQNYSCFLRQFPGWQNTGSIRDDLFSIRISAPDNGKEKHRPSDWDSSPPRPAKNLQSAAFHAMVKVNLITTAQIGFLGWDGALAGKGKSR